MRCSLPCGNVLELSVPPVGAEENKAILEETSQTEIDLITAVQTSFP